MASAAATAGGVGAAVVSHGVVSTAAAAGACTLTGVPGSCSQACCTAAMAHNPHPAHLQQPWQQHPSSVQGQLAASPPNGYTQPRSRLRTNAMGSASTSSLQSIEAEFKRLHEQKQLQQQQQQQPAQLGKMGRHSTFGSPHEGLGPQVLAHADPHANNDSGGNGGWGMSPAHLQARALPTLLQQRQQQQRQQQENQVVPELQLAHGPQHYQHSCGSNDARGRDHSHATTSGAADAGAAADGASVALPGDAMSAWLGGHPYTTAGLPSPMLLRKGSAAAADLAAAGIAVPLSYRQRVVLAAQTRGSAAVPGEAASLAAGPAGAKAAAASVSAAQAAYSALISGPGFSYAAAEAQDGMPSGSYGISISLGGGGSSSDDEDDDGRGGDDDDLHLRDEDFLLSGYGHSDEGHDEDVGQGVKGKRSGGRGPQQQQVRPPPLLPLKVRPAALGRTVDPEPSCGSSSGSSGHKPAALTFALPGEDSSDPNKGCASPAVLECKGETSLGGVRPVAVRPLAAAAAAAAASVFCGAVGGSHVGGAAAAPWRRTAAGPDPATSAAGAAAAATLCEPVPMSDVEPPSAGVQRMCSEASETEAEAEAPAGMELGSSSGSGSEGENGGVGCLSGSAARGQEGGGVGGVRGEEEWAEAREDWVHDGGEAEHEEQEDGISSEDGCGDADDEGEGSGEPPDRSMSGGSQLSTSVGSGGAATAAPAAVAGGAAGGARAEQELPFGQLPPRGAGDASTAAAQVQPGCEALQGLAALMQPWLAQPQWQLQPPLAPLVAAAPQLHLTAVPAPLAVQQLLGVPPAPLPLPLALGLAAAAGGAVGPPMPLLGPAVLQAAPASVAPPLVMAALHNWLPLQQAQQHQQQLQPQTAAAVADGSSGTGTADGTGVRTAGAGISSAWLAPDAQQPSASQQKHMCIAAAAAAAADAQAPGVNTAHLFGAQLAHTQHTQERQQQQRVDPAATAAALASHPVLLQAHYLAAAARAPNAIPPYHGPAPLPAPAYEWTNGQGQAAGPQPPLPLPLAQVQAATAAAAAAASAAARPQASRLLPPETYIGLVMEIINSVQALPSQQAAWQQQQQQQQRQMQQREMQLMPHQAGQWQVQGHGGQGGAGFGAGGLYLQQQ